MEGRKAARNSNPCNIESDLFNLSFQLRPLEHFERLHYYRHHTVQPPASTSDHYRNSLFDIPNDYPAASIVELPERPSAPALHWFSLDGIISHRKEVARRKHETTRPYLAHKAAVMEIKSLGADTGKRLSNHGDDDATSICSSQAKSPTGFSHWFTEAGFCFTVAMTQLLTEYLISGFAVELPTLLSNYLNTESSSLGVFWPATLLSLTLSSSLLIFARLTDLCGGYPCFMFGTIWLSIWCLLPGLIRTAIMLDVSRAMQGLAIAAFTPSSFAMIGSVYPAGPRRNLIIGFYSGCAPIGFFSGIITASTLSSDKGYWYFWTASILSLTIAITGYLTVPCDRVDRKDLNISMDWLGAFLITAGLILVAYALAFEPYATCSAKSKSGFECAGVYAPLICGLLSLLVAVYVEGWYAKCPLVPFDFFKPKGIISFSIAALCFYATFGAWLYTSVDFFQGSTGATTYAEGVHGVRLAVWYLPFFVGGLILCVVTSTLLHIVPIMIMLLISGLAWIGAPLLLAVIPLPLHYWSSVFPSMLCATIGIDVTFTISIVFLSSIQPIQYQGLAGAVCSILVNLAISFSLPISEIIRNQAKADAAQQSSLVGSELTSLSQIWGCRSALIYATISAGCGLAICLYFVRISDSVARGEYGDGETNKPLSGTECEV